MNKILFSTVVASLLTGSLFAYSVDGNPEIKFVGYKLAKKTGVEGNFKEVGFKSVANDKFDIFLKSFEFSIDPKNINTKLPDRDKRIGIIFDGNMINGKIISVSGDEKAGELEVEIDIKSNKKTYKAPYSVNNGKLSAKITVDLLADFKLNESFEKFATAAKPFHSGKSYTDVDISLEATIK